MPMWMQVVATVVFALVAVFCVLLAVAGLVTRNDPDARESGRLHWVAFGMVTGIAVVASIAIVAVWV